LEKVISNPDPYIIIIIIIIIIGKTAPFDP
jgi:hypothetical protein